jgi:hypothetical protein
MVDDSQARLSRAARNAKTNGNGGNRAGSVCLNNQLTAAKWISAMVMLQRGLAVAQ